MTESHSIPAIAMTAYALASESWRQTLNTLGQQTIAALGLNAADKWHVNFDTGTVSREVPDPSSESPGVPTAE